MPRMLRRALSRAKTRSPPKQMNFYSVSLSSVQKVREKSVNYLGKVDIGLPETMLPARLVFLKPRWQRCRDSKILVTMAFWEAHLRHAGELSVFFCREKAILPLGYIG